MCQLSVCQCECVCQLSVCQCECVCVRERERERDECIHMLLFLVYIIRPTSIKNKYTYFICIYETPLQFGFKYGCKVWLCDFSNLTNGVLH